MKKLFPPIYFFLLTCLIFGPLFVSHGYIFLLDYIPQSFDLNINSYIVNGKIFNDIPFLYIFSFLTNKVDGVQLQKIFFFFIFFAIGLFSYYSLKPIKSTTARIIASTFYVVNPFVYERFMAGHIFLLLGYAILPIYFYYLLSIFNYFTENKGGKYPNKNIILTAIFGTLMVIFSVHFAIILTVPLFAIFLSKIIFARKKEIKNTLIIFAKLILLLFIFNSFWILPALFFKPAFLNTFNISHFYAFKTAADAKFGLLLNILGLYGFWREYSAPEEIILTKNLLFNWPAFLIPIAVTASTGIFSLFKEKKYSLFLSLILILIASVFLVAGPQMKTNIWLFEHFPSLKGLREIEKFSALIALVYCFLIAYGVAFLKQRLKKPVFMIIGTILFLTILIYNYKIFWGFGGQIKTFNYPPSYEKLAELKQEKDDYKILLLPWHMYARYSFGNGRNLIDPARAYSSSKLLATQDMGIKEVLSQESNEGKAIKDLLRRADDSIWRDVLKSLNVKYIFINKTPLDLPKKFDDSFIEKSIYFQKISEDNFAKLFIVK